MISPTIWDFINLILLVLFQLIIVFKFIQLKKILKQIKSKEVMGE